MHTENAWTKQKASALLEWLFLLVTAIYLVCQCVYQSTYVLPSYTFPDRPVFQMILCAAAVLALGKTALNGFPGVPDRERAFPADDSGADGRDGRG